MELNIDGQVIQVEELGNMFIVNDPELLDWENEKMEMVNEGREMLKKIAEIKEEQAQLEIKINRVKEKIVPRAEKIINMLELGEYELIETVELEDGKVVMKITDLLAEFKEQVKTIKEKIHGTNNNTETSDRGLESGEEVQGETGEIEAKEEVEITEETEQ